jgi:arginase
MPILPDPPAIQAAIDLIGFPMDLGADRRGVDMGPSALRIASLHDRLQQLGYQVTDHGDLAIEIRERLAVENPRLKYLDEIVKKSTILAGMVQQTLAAGRFPLCIGGDHTIALGSLAGIAAHCKERQRTPGVLWIDAHGDMNTEQTTPSGNIHGMALAASLGLGHQRLTHLLGFAPKIMPEHCALVGVRQLDPGERETIRNIHLPVYTMTDIDRRGMAVIIDEILQRMRQSVQHLHVSFDLDSIDPSLAQGVGTPVAGGLSYREAHLLMETIADCGCVSSMDLAEMNPILDVANKSAEFAVGLLASLMGKRIL